MPRRRNDPTSRDAILRASAAAERLMGRELARGLAHAAAAIRDAARRPDIATSAKARADAYREILVALAEAGGKMTPELERAIDKRCREVADGTAKALPDNSPHRYELTKEQRIDAVNGKTARQLVATQTQSMAEHAVRELRTAFVEAMRRGQVEGWTANELQKRIQEAWDEKAGDENAFRFVDRGGRAWSNATYLQMAVRTTMQKITRNQMCATLAGNGYDVARISDDGGGGDDCDACSRWEGRLVSITGATKGLPTLADAEADGLFHPNCVHRIEYVDDDELPEELRKETVRQLEESADGDEPHETDAERAARERAEAEERERKTMSDGLLSQMPRGMRAERGDVFKDTPIGILRKIHDSVVNFVSARGGAYCESVSGIVHIKNDPNNWSGTRNTLHHECGHAVLGKIIGPYTSATPIPDALKPIFDAAKRETEAIAERTYGEHWRTEATGKQYFDVAKSVLGIVRSEEDYYAKTTEERNEVASFCDLMHSATMGRQFFGHGRSYYNHGGEVSALHEIVADATAIMSGPLADKGNALFPDTMREIRKAVYGMQG